MRQGISDYKVTEIFCLADDFWSDFLVYGKSWHRLSVQDADHFSDSSHLTHIDIGLMAPYYGLIKQRIAWNKKHVDLSDTFCICALYPFRNTQHKRRQTCAHSEVVKFDHFEIRVMYQLSSAGKFNSVAVPQPVSQHHGGRLNSAETVGSIYAVSFNGIQVEFSTNPHIRICTNPSTDLPTLRHSYPGTPTPTAISV